MAYTVAAICGNNENFGYKKIFSNNELLTLVGTSSIKVGLNTGSNLNQTFEHSFNPTGYSQWPNTIEEMTPTKRYAAVLGSYIAVTSNKTLIMSNGVTFSMSLGVGFYSCVRVIQNNVSTTQELYTGSTSLQENNFNILIPLGITAGLDTFYMVALEVRATNRSNTTELLKIRSSTDGVNWSDTGASIRMNGNTLPVIDSFFDSIQNREFQEIKLQRTLLGERYFLYSEYSGRVIYSNATFNEWTDHPIGRFDGMHWYKDNGNMYLCAVRIGDNGCYGTKICDAYGNIQPISWRKSATPWDRTKNRLDAGYVVGMNREPRIKVTYVYISRESIIRREITQENLMPDGFYYLDMIVVGMPPNYKIWASTAIQPEILTDDVRISLPMPGGLYLMNRDTEAIIKDFSDGFGKENELQWPLVEENVNYVLRLKTDVKSAFLLYFSYRGE